MSKKTPKVSVIMAEYNTRRCDLENSIKSILEQSFQDFEFIIVDDCGKNDLDAINKKFNDKRIKIIKNVRNKGLEYSLNRAIKSAKADFLVRMDTDDIAKPARIKKLYSYITRHSEFAVVGSMAVEFTDNVEIGVLGRCGEKTAKELVYGHAPFHPSVIMRKSAVVDVGGYVDYYKRAEDFALWCELLLKGYRLYVINDILLKYRVNPEDYDKRRLKNRIGEIRARLHYYPKLKAPFLGYFVIVKSIFSGLLPIKFVRLYRKNIVMRRNK